MITSPQHEPNPHFSIIDLDLPEEWGPALLNGYTSCYDETDLLAIAEFERDMITRYGQCSCLSVTSPDIADLRQYHDATSYGVPACNVALFSFDIPAGS